MTRLDPWRCLGLAILCLSASLVIWLASLLIETL